MQLEMFIDNTPSIFDEMRQVLGFSATAGWPDSFGKALRSWSEQNNIRVKTLSLFSGAGGLDIGFHDAGFEVEAMVEIDDRFATTLRENSGPNKYFGEPEVLSIDVRNYHPDPNKNINFIIGGPPCQPFSAAGRRVAGVQGTCDNRGTLFEEYVRLLEEFSPIGFLFENVYGITGAQNGKAWRRIREAFKNAGYNVFARILDAADYGVPQHRERLFIVGTKEADFLFPKPTHGPDSQGNYPFYIAEEAIQDLRLTQEERLCRVGGRYGDLLDDIPPGLNYSYYTETMGHPSPVFAWRSKFSDFLYKADPKTPVRTIKAQGGQFTGPFHWENRPFSISELKRLQTFPDDYYIVGGKQVVMHQIGNSVPPQLARVLALSILKQIFKVDLPFDLPLLSHGQNLGFRKRKRLLTSRYREKAQKAIAKIEEPINESSKASSRLYRVALGKNFDLRESDCNEKNSLLVSFVPDENQWIFKVSCGPTSKKSSRSSKKLINVNFATAARLESLPRIGSKRAAVIIEFREKYGRFKKKKDLLKIKGIGPKNFEAIKDKISIEQIDTENEALININVAKAKELTTLPLIGPKKAKLIIRHRKSFGVFKQLRDITNVSGVGPKIFDLIKSKICVSLKESSNLFTITVAPNNSWSLGVDKVILQGEPLSKRVFTSAWKAFEAELNRLNIKADLVQLCGYYQYTSSFSCEMSFDKSLNGSKEWGVLSKVVSGIGVREIFPKEELADFWGVPAEKVIEYAVFLKRLGYEVRNQSTNPQLPADHYLIPYPFPTLNPLSVQLRKRLR